jgi:hypothetical protein
MVYELKTENGKFADRIHQNVFLVGLITFLIAAIFPTIMTINFLIEFMPEIQAWAFTVDFYGDIKAGIELTFVIAYWLMIPIPLTITGMLTKRILYTEKQWLIAIMPVITVGLVVAFCFLSLYISNFLT